VADRQKDTTVARGLYDRALKLGSLQAYVGIGALYQDQGEFSQAKRWFEKAADSGHLGALVALGKMAAQDKGAGEGRDIPEAIRWLEKAASADFVWAMYELAEVYRNEVRNEELETKWYQKAIDRRWEQYQMAADPVAMKAAGLVRQINRQSWIDSIIFSKDGNKVLIGSFEDVSLLDSKTFEVVGVYKDPLSHYSHREAKFSPDERFLATTHFTLGDTGVFFWDIESGSLISQFKGATDGPINFCSDAKKLMGVRSGFKKEREHLHYGVDASFWEIATGKRTIKFVPSPNRRSNTESKALSMSPNCQHIAFADGSLVYVVHLGSGKAIELRGHLDSVWKTAFSADGRQIASVAKGILRLWNVETGKLIREFDKSSEEFNAVAFSPDGRRILAGTRNGGLYMWNVDSDKIVKVFSFPKPSLNIKSNNNVVSAVAFSPDGHSILSADHDGVLRLWVLN
jgi:hypothetical protein